MADSANHINKNNTPNSRTFFGFSNVITSQNIHAQPNCLSNLENFKNLNLEYSYSDVPEFIFEISSTCFLKDGSENLADTTNTANSNHEHLTDFSRQKAKFYLKNLTNAADDIPIFLTSKKNTECVLSNEVHEIFDLDMIIIYDMQFIFYQNFSKEDQR